MDTKTLFCRSAFSTSLAVLMTFLGPCSFEGCPSPSVFDICGKFDELPLTTLVLPTPTVGFENPGTIKVIHGSGTATLDHGDLIKVEQSLEIPEYANRATVFLNGWKSSYFGDDDQHVAGLGTLIGKIRLEGRKLTWNAAGILRDDGGEEGYGWSYYYTVIAWNDAALNLLVNHDDANDFCKAGTGGSDNFYSAPNWAGITKTTTALSSFSSFLQNPDFPPSGTVAILPRGFGFSLCGDDDLLQMAYNLDHSETLVEYGKKYQKAIEDVPAPLPTPFSSADSRFVSWNTYTIFKDNSGRRDYDFGEMVSALGGNDVEVLQPPFSILPREDLGGDACIPQDDLHYVNTEDFVIENVPFEYAIPMLTGWELRYDCGDENVKEIGIWIDRWSYVKDPAALTGRLSYTLSSVLRDKDDDPGHKRSHKVTILGLRPTAGVIGRQKAPDLVPFSPSGNSATAFCRLEQGRKLRVTVKNPGNENAAASKTTVTFDNKPVSVDTPAIPAGGSVDLLFDVPASCFNADCSFKITVDSNNQLDELNLEGNNSANGSCIGRTRLN